jgi:maltose O-acetyltransferase
VGGGVLLCPDTKIGDGAAVKAGSAVTRDIPLGVFAAGNLCRAIGALQENGRAR